MARFVVYLKPAEGGGYVASVPALPGCVTRGETREEALAVVEDDREPLPFWPGQAGITVDEFKIPLS